MNSYLIREKLVRYAAMFVFLASKTVHIEIKELTGDRFTSVETQTIYLKVAQIGTNFVDAGNEFCFKQKQH